MQNAMNAKMGVQKPNNIARPDESSPIGTSRANATVCGMANRVR